MLVELGMSTRTKKIIAYTMKLIGNSVYGSLIMDKEKHQDTLYAQGWGATQLKINDPCFKKCTNITDDTYEVEMAKKKIRFDLPIQLGYHILQLAKLRMLQFRSCENGTRESCHPKVSLLTWKFYPLTLLFVITIHTRVINCLILADLWQY